MYERKVYHAIQHTNHIELHLRYRTYPTKKARDSDFELIQSQQDEPNPLIEMVTLTVTAESVTEERLF